MRVAMIGTGYVGLVSGACFAEFGHQVTCIDINQSKIDKLKNGECPIYEPRLEELLKHNIAAGRLSFSTDYSAIKDAKVIFLAVGTPSTDSGEANLQYLFDAAKTLSSTMTDGAVVVIKSTVPI